MHLFPAGFLHPVKFLMVCRKLIRCPLSAMVKVDNLFSETAMQNNILDDNSIFNSNV